MRSTAARALGAIACLLCLGPIACHTPRPVLAEEVYGPIHWGATGNVWWVRNIWISAQPDSAALRAARKAGVRTVINLREPSELGFDEEAAVRDLGLAYHAVPIPREGPLPEASLRRVDSIVGKHRRGQILVHCASGSRAAGWFTTHLYRVHSMNVEEAIDLGRRAGLTSPKMQDRVRDFLIQLGDEDDEFWHGLDAEPLTSL